MLTGLCMLRGSEFPSNSVFSELAAIAEFSLAGIHIPIDKIRKLAATWDVHTVLIFEEDAAYGPHWWNWSGAAE